MKIMHHWFYLSLDLLSAKKNGENNGLYENSKILIILYHLWVCIHKVKQLFMYDDKTLFSYFLSNSFSTMFQVNSYLK